MGTDIYPVVCLDSVSILDQGGLLRIEAVEPDRKGIAPV